MNFPVEINQGSAAVSHSSQQPHYAGPMKKWLCTNDFFQLQNILGALPNQVTFNYLLIVGHINEKATLGQLVLCLRKTCTVGKT